MYKESSKDSIKLIDEITHGDYWSWAVKAYQRQYNDDGNEWNVVNFYLSMNSI